MATEFVYSNTSSVINYSATMIWNMIRDAMQVPNWHPFMWHNPDFDSSDPNSIGVDHVVNWPGTTPALEPAGEKYMGIYKFYEISDVPANMYIRYNVIVLVSDSIAAGDWDNFVDFTVTPVTDNSCTVKIDRYLDFGPMPPSLNHEYTRERTSWLTDECLMGIEGVVWDATIEQLKNPNKQPAPPIPNPN